MGTTLSGEQRAWLKELGNMVGGAAAKPTDEDKPQLVALEGGSEDDRQALVGGLIPGIPDLPDIPILPGDGEVITKITIKNATGLALRFVSGSASLENLTATFSSPPPVDIAAGTSAAPGEGSFTVHNKRALLNAFNPGTGGEVKYELVGDPRKTQLFMKWERGGIKPARTMKTAITPSTDQFTLDGTNTGGDDFQFDVAAKGGVVPPKPDPKPNPTPGSDVQSSCLITVKNDTQLPLKLSDSGHERGDFMALVPDTVAPGSSITVVSVETPNSPDQGCKGFIVWEVGSPMVAAWRIEWDNPEGAKNTTDASLTPQTAGFKSVDQIGQGEENVPAAFTISGGGEGPGPQPGPQPGPKPGPEPEPEPPFEPPVEAKQPTLRKGDKSPDGWVEYAQLLLNFHLKSNLPEDGDFGAGTQAAVLKFQKEKKLQVDGTIGNQTWAALREGAPEKPSTDGRQPHTFVEQGVEARWLLESQINNRYFKSSDTLRLAVESVGDTPIDNSTEATVRITAPGAKPRVVKVKVGNPTPSKTRKAFTNEVTIGSFRKDFPSVPPDAPVADYLVEAFLPKDLGGDFYSGKVLED